MGETDICSYQNGSRKMAKHHKYDPKKGDSEPGLETEKKHDGIKTIVSPWKWGDHLNGHLHKTVLSKREHCAFWPEQKI